MKNKQTFSSDVRIRRLAIHMGCRRLPFGGYQVYRLADEAEICRATSSRGAWQKAIAMVSFASPPKSKQRPWLAVFSRRDAYSGRVQKRHYQVFGRDYEDAFLAARSREGSKGWVLSIRPWSEATEMERKLAGVEQ